MKWHHWIEPTAHLSEEDGRVGLYEGGNYRKEGVWRPTKNSQMNSASGHPFHAVNGEAWALQVYKRAKPVHRTTPDATQVYYHDKNQFARYTVGSVLEYGIQKVEWYIDGELVAVGPEKEYALTELMQGEYEVTAIVYDDTGAIRKDEEDVSSAVIVWQVNAQ